jgi:hypothetical protein
VVGPAEQYALLGPVDVLRDVRHGNFREVHLLREFLQFSFGDVGLVDHAHLPLRWRERFIWRARLNLLDLVLWHGRQIGGWRSLYHRVRLHIGTGVQRLVELLELKELPTIPEQVSQLLDVVV